MVADVDGATHEFEARLGATVVSRWKGFAGDASHFVLGHVIGVVHHFVDARIGYLVAGFEDVAYSCHDYLLCWAEWNASPDSGGYRYVTSTLTPGASADTLSFPGARHMAELDVNLLGLDGANLLGERHTGRL